MMMKYHSFMIALERKIDFKGKLKACEFIFLICENSGGEFNFDIS